MMLRRSAASMSEHTPLGFSGAGARIRRRGRAGRWRGTTLACNVRGEARDDPAADRSPTRWRFAAAGPAFGRDARPNFLDFKVHSRKADLESPILGRQSRLPG